MTLGRCLQVLAWEFKEALEKDDTARRKNPAHFCKTMRTCLRAHRIFAAMSGGIFLVLVSFAATQLVFSAYYFCVVYLGIDWGSDIEPTSARVFTIVSYGVSCLLYFKRLLHFANLSHALSKAVSGATERLIDLEGASETCTLEVTY